MIEPEIRKALERFQDGYARRDPEGIDEFMKLFDEKVEVIGTNAVEKGKGEWTTGIEGARKLVLDDWKGWGDLELDLENASIRANRQTGWVSIYGVLSFELDPEKNCQEFLRYAEKVASQDNEGGAQERLMKIIKLGSSTMYHAQSGPGFRLPIRISAVLEKTDAWRFVQLHFSFSTNDFPDIRY